MRQEVQGSLQVGQGLVQVDDVDAQSAAEQIRLHVSDIQSSAMTRRRQLDEMQLFNNVNHFYIYITMWMNVIVWSQLDIKAYHEPS